MIVELESLERQLITHEGLRLFPYDDATGHQVKRGSKVSGCLTIGVGHNLTDRGLTKEQCLMLFREDIATVMGELDAAFPWFRMLDWTRQACLIDMAFNLGLPKLAEFARTLTAIQHGQFYDASVFMLESHWAEQVGNRALTLSHMMETGINPFTDGRRA